MCLVVPINERGYNIRVVESVAMVVMNVVPSLSDVPIIVDPNPWLAIHATHTTIPRNVIIPYPRANNQQDCDQNTIWEDINNAIKVAHVLNQCTDHG